MKKIVFLISVVTAFFILWIYQKNSTDHTSVTTSSNSFHFAKEDVETAHVRSDKKSANDNADTGISEKNISKPDLSEQPGHLQYSEQDLADRRAWIEKREREESTQRLYSSYEESVLIELADQGDLMAVKQLHHRIQQELIEAPQPTGSEMTAEYMQWQQQTVDKMDKYVYEAILLGDRELLGHGARLFQTYLGAGTGTDARARALDSLAFYEFANMRGDVLLGQVGPEGAIRHFERTHGPLQLSDSEKAAVQSRARQIYDELENKRIELGLEPFDNTVSEWELKRAESMRQRMRNLQP